ncbi:hypothetical protein SLEP1_g40087 [Rubroshorea leprosula]|uniref:Uncharacterized protein n=1 Tax=Rubroshorea leprosula TaxID=152421 RepID=A0AAV5L2Y4_9ROSI|nr:hypothetical protein SLEP1_g40087 [Rubroshorea leprosula]
MAEATREMVGFKEVNWTVNGECKLEKKDFDSASNLPNLGQSMSNNNKVSIRNSLYSGLPLPPSLPKPALTDIVLGTSTHHVNYKAVDYSNYGKHTSYQSSYLWSDGKAKLKRKRRVVKYKSYTVESQMKTSLRSGFRWIKNKYCELVHGYY